MINVITKEDLEQFKVELLNEIKQLISADKTSELVETSNYLKSKQVQRKLSISPGTLQNLRINGTIPYTKIGGVIYYPQDEIEKLLKNNMRNFSV